MGITFWLIAGPVVAVVIGFALGEIVMRNRIKRQIAHGLSSGLMKININNDEVDDVGYLFSRICSRKWGAENNAFSMDGDTNDRGPYDPPRS